MVRLLITHYISFNVIFSEVKVELERLFQQDDTVIYGERFRLLAWQISGDLNGMPEIATLQNGYVVTILTLYYFVKVSLLKL